MFSFVIVDLRLGSRDVLVIGGGREATKRVSAMSQEDCAITVVAPSISEDIRGMAAKGRVTIIREKADASVLEKMRPDMVVAATDDHVLNKALMFEARRCHILGYSSSDPQHSDYAHMAQADFGGVVKIAVSTGGRSPTAAIRIRDDIRESLENTITPQMIQEIKRLGSEREKTT